MFVFFLSGTVSVDDSGVSWETSTVLTVSLLNNHCLDCKCKILNSYDTKTRGKRTNAPLPFDKGIDYNLHSNRRRH